MEKKSPKFFWLLVFAVAIMAAVGGFMAAQASVETALAQAPCAPGSPGCPFTELQRAATGFTGEDTEFARAPTSLQLTAFRIIRFGLGIFGSYFLAMILYAGWMYFSAGGESEKVEKAKKTIRNAIIGMIIVATSYAVLTLVFQSIFPRVVDFDIGDGEWQLLDGEESDEATFESFEGDVTPGPGSGFRIPDSGELPA